MPAFRRLLERWGFVKLSRYGLELTPDGRIVSRRPVLDDGTGTRIVGWQDGDVAIWKLSNRTDSVRIPRLALPASSQLEPATHRTSSPATGEGSSRSAASRSLPGVAPVLASAAPAARSAAATSTSGAAAPDAPAAALTPVTTTALAARAATAPASRSLAAAAIAEAGPAPAGPGTTAPLPVSASRTSFAAIAASQESTAAAAATPYAPPAAAAAVSVSPARASAIIAPLEVASPPVVDEDDWEWTIALARARVAVEESQSVPRSTPPHAAPVLQGRVTSRPPAIREPTTTGDWPATAPIGSIDYDDYRVATRPAIPLPSLHSTGARPAPTTVIPVPPLPTLETTMHVRLEPVVRAGHAPPPIGRLAKGTGPVDPEPAASRRHASMLIDEATAHLGVGDRTRPGVAVAAAQARRAGTTLGTAAPASSDHTKPGIALPPVARAVALPSTKRRNVPR